MTLEEAIVHCEDVAESKRKQVENGDWENGSLTERDCLECAKEHRQLAEWLKELKAYKEQTDGDLISRQAVITMLQKIENAVEDGDGFQFNEWIEYAKNIPSFKNMASWVELDDYPNEDWECDNCGFVITGVEEPYRYCPNCGKKMWK